jgi:hypothetical protein
MADDQRVRPIVPVGQPGPKASSPIHDRGLRFFLGGPPGVLDRRKIVCRPIPFEIGAGRADVAGEGVTLPHDRIDGDWQAQRLGDRAGGLQGSGVWRDDDALDSLPQKLLGGFPRLGVPERGEARVDDAGIAAGGAEMQVELALAVAQQDHGTDLPLAGAGSNGGFWQGFVVMTLGRAYLSGGEEAFLWVQAADFQSIWSFLG